MDVYMRESELQVGMLILYNGDPALVVKTSSMWDGMLTLLKRDGTTAYINSLYIKRDWVLGKNNKK